MRAPSCRTSSAATYECDIDCGILDVPERASPRAKRRICHLYKAGWKTGALLTFVLVSCVLRWTVSTPSVGQSSWRNTVLGRASRLALNAYMTPEQRERRRLAKKSICKSVYGRIDGDNARTRGKDLSRSKKEKIKSGSSCPSSYDDGGFPMFVAAVFVTLYLFVGIAIVCDELFVSALEIISERWELSDDVSGATLMAAGGSAPELATSFLGTFQGSPVGLGTIVGSAVFNVLFVIGMCALKTPKEYAPLALTWWPLARDCTYYILTLSALLIWFISPNSRGAIEGWEACLQLSLYVGYVIFMKHNALVEATVKARLGGRKIEPQRLEVLPNDPPIDRKGSISDDKNFHATFLKPSTFRNSIVNLLMNRSKDSIQSTAGVCIVSKIKGDVTETFKELDVDHNGKLDFGELSQLLNRLGDPDVVTDEKVRELREKLDSNHNNCIDLHEFTSWYIGSESRLKAEAKNIFDAFDLDKSGSIEVHEVREVVSQLADGYPLLQKEIDASVEDFKRTVVASGNDSCNFEEFQHWYQSTVFWEKAKHEAQEAQCAIQGMWTAVLSSIYELPSMSFGDAVIVVLLLPLNFTLALTTPDCRVPGREAWCYATFVGSIVWIAFYSYFMVKCIEIIGCYIGVNPFIMGLIPLAAGTSVPDMLSSVVVAKQGKGDMAVSSSIGSNIFDVAVGLPLPWLCFTIYYWCPVQVGGTWQNNSISVSILLLMVILVISSIAYMDWKMSHNLGRTMFILYFLFCGQELVRNFA